ncbi:MAG: glycosyl hydrolase 53 family protein, partial [Acetatifactor muris]|nr:glycosyl hydrolase 53 family protein [Acetatifactor muris]
MFYKGMDISFLPQCEEEGMQTKDMDGTVMDPFELVEKYGVNAIRLRIWHTPENIERSGGYCNLEHTIAMAKRIKAHRMAFMLDFHYSDFWADPGNQRKPKAWENLSFEELQAAVFAYTQDTLSALKARDVMPDIVQIGNEIRSGLLFPEGELPNYEQMVKLINAGIDGARAVEDPDMKIMIHLDQGGRYFYLKEWFEKSFQKGLKDFDLIGLSYYPFWHGTYTDLKETMEHLIQDYHRPVMIVETAHAWRKCEGGFIDDIQEKIAGFPATPKGQRQVLELVTSILASLPEHMGQGIFYWEPLCTPKAGGGGWASNMGLLDEDGRVLEGMKAFTFDTDHVEKDKWVKVYEPQTVTAQADQRVTLPTEVSVLMADGSIIKEKVTWEEGEIVSCREVGNRILRGYVGVVRYPIQMEIRTERALEAGANLIEDPNWNEGMARWQAESSGEEVIAQLFPEFVDPYPAPPLNALRVECARHFSFRISQQVNVAEAGRYCLPGEVQGT